MLILTILLILNLCLIIFFNKFSIFVNLYDKPDNIRKLQKKPIASIGGFLILINLSLFFFLKNHDFFFLKKIANDNNQISNFFYLTVLFFFLIGYLDDKFNLNANLKLFFFFILITFILLVSEDMIIINLKFSFLEKSINLGTYGFLFTALCILLFLNAFNMFDGINLQSSIYSIHIFFLFFLRDIFADISLVLIISLLFFSYLNIKNKCFLGNNGSLMIAFVISSLLIKSQYTINPFYADEIFLIMQIPGLDMLRLAIQRVIEKKHPFSSDRNHIHHLFLENYGLTKTLILLSFLIIIPNILSFFYGNTLFYIFATFVIYIFIIYKLNKKSRLSV